MSLAERASPPSCPSHTTTSVAPPAVKPSTAAFTSPVRSFCDSAHRGLFRGLHWSVQLKIPSTPSMSEMIKTLGPRGSFDGDCSVSRAEGMAPAVAIPAPVATPLLKNSLRLIPPLALWTIGVGMRSHQKCQAGRARVPQASQTNSSDAVFKQFVLIPGPSALPVPADKKPRPSDMR